MNEAQKKILSRIERQCARTEYCSHDMLKKAISLLEGDKEAAEEMLGALRSNGFVDDSRYAAAFAREKAGITGWGPMKIRLALRAKQIPDETINAALDEIDGNRAEQKLRKLMESKWRALSGDEAARLKLLRYALSRGYDYDMVSRIADQITGKS